MCRPREEYLRARPGPSRSAAETEVMLLAPAADSMNPPPLFCSVTAAPFAASHNSGKSERRGVVCDETNRRPRCEILLLRGDDWRPS